MTDKINGRPVIGNAGAPVGNGPLVVVDRLDDMRLLDLLDPRERFAINYCSEKVCALDYVEEKEKDKAGEISTLDCLLYKRSPLIPLNLRALAAQRRLDLRAIRLIQHFERRRPPWRRQRP
jgi:hypothetical protein